MNHLFRPNCDLLAERSEHLRPERRQSHAQQAKAQTKSQPSRPADRETVRSKTAGRCHLCGGEVGPRWQADHVLAHAGGGRPRDRQLPAGPRALQQVQAALQPRRVSVGAEDRRVGTEPDGDRGRARHRDARPSSSSMTVGARGDGFHASPAAGSPSAGVAARRDDAPGLLTDSGSDRRRSAGEPRSRSTTAWTRSAIPVRVVSCWSSLRRSVRTVAPPRVLNRPCRRFPHRRRRVPVPCECHSSADGTAPCECHQCHHPFRGGTWHTAGTHLLSTASLRFVGRTPPSTISGRRETTPAAPEPLPPTIERARTRIAGPDPCGAPQPGQQIVNARISESQAKALTKSSSHRGQPA